MLEAPVEGAWGLTVTDDFIDKASAAGFTSVRLPVRWSNHASARAPFTIDPAFIGRVDITTIHDYDPFRFTHQGAEWVSPLLPVGVTCCSAAQEAEMTAPLDVAKAWSTAKRDPVFVGEFGAYGAAPDDSRIDFDRKMRQAIEGRGMTWTYWEFAAGFGVYDPVKRTFRQGLLDSLLGG
jgi:aryl-phospho-beta-D-glucosidase BglC (GH1 family)